MKLKIVTNNLKNIQQTNSNIETSVARLYIQQDYSIKKNI